ncbi:unnamed protein product [Didymodactylos carnosus]|uniref:Uncharacterized protein n=1 Tax=Didymodactylos carnosus TaxID=1234261 RepID=A0A813W0S5_9BILA|nr:unnamed protein product [Didymodactylos carnosus]CAF1295998.1 unnamed protein product [Didymodactylos carnosus]CAF3632240.1 unnamed protein product [Didymodactylos carnosus]CAF4101249.1 unnamed protein product [Didymodactylos carnosus]
MLQQAKSSTSRSLYRGSEVSFSERSSKAYFRALEIPLKQPIGNAKDIWGPQPQCIICEYLQTGLCDKNNNSCYCFANKTITYEPPYCENSTESSLQSAASTNWPLIIGIISGIAGLVLITVLCMFFIFRQKTSYRPIWRIPRAKLPTVGSMIPLDKEGFTNIERDSDNESSNLSAQQPTSSTYRTMDDSKQTMGTIDSEFFKNLENISLMNNSIPRSQISFTIDTLNNLPVKNNITSDTFSDFDDFGEIEFIANMLDDMTKNDNQNDEFVEALNPIFAIPRANLTPKPTKLFSVSS